MNILNLYFSGTGNTKKVADMIEETARNMGSAVNTVRISTTMEMEFDLLEYDMVFAGSGVYEWLPGKPSNLTL
jgi:flavodoxin